MNISHSKFLKNLTEQAKERRFEPATSRHESQNSGNQAPFHPLLLPYLPAYEAASIVIHFRFFISYHSSETLVSF